MTGRMDNSALKHRSAPGVIGAQYVEITSGHFLLFLFATLVIYYLLPRRPQNYWLLIVSYIFCITWSWEVAAVLLFVTAINFLLGHRLRVNDEGRRGLLWLGLGLNVLVLVFFRTADFFVPEMSNLLGQLGVENKLGTLQILLPVGLSFYIVENIAYLVDVYRGQFQATDDPVDFALYLAYFPKLLAGPIERLKVDEAPKTPTKDAPKVLEDEPKAETTSEPAGDDAPAAEAPATTEPDQG